MLVKYGFTIAFAHSFLPEPLSEGHPFRREFPAFPGESFATESTMLTSNTLCLPPSLDQTER